MHRPFGRRRRWRRSGRDLFVVVGNRGEKFALDLIARDRGGTRRLLCGRRSQRCRCRVDSFLSRLKFAIAWISRQERVDFFARFVEQLLADVEIDLADLFDRRFVDGELAAERFDAEERLLLRSGDRFGFELAERQLVDGRLDDFFRCRKRLFEIDEFGRYLRCRRFESEADFLR